MKVANAPFALRVVRRRSGDTGLVYRRALASGGKERFRRVGTLAPLAFTAGTPLLRSAVRAVSGPGTRLARGPFHPLDLDWGARVACFALVASGLRDAGRLARAADHLSAADGAEAAWWLGLMTRPSGERAVRALRILTEAVQ